VAAVARGAAFSEEAGTEASPMAGVLSSGAQAKKLGLG